MPRKAWDSSAGVSGFRSCVGKIYMYYVYIIKSINKSWYYVGSTDNVLKRVLEHNQGITPSTKPHRPFELMLVEEYPTKTEARKRENKIKKNHALKKSLIPNLK